MKKTELKKYLKESNGRISIYDLKIMEAEKTFRQLNSLNMQGVLIQIEDCLDSNNVYAYQNWFEGFVWDGPTVKRHWVDITIKYDYECMPDPMGGMRLLEQGIKVFYELSYEIIPVTPETKDDIDSQTKKPKEEKKDIWLVHMKFPRHFIDGAIEDEPEEIEQEEDTFSGDEMDMGDEMGDNTEGAPEMGGEEAPIEGNENEL